MISVKKTLKAIVNKIQNSQWTLVWSGSTSTVSGTLTISGIGKAKELRMYVYNNNNNYYVEGMISNNAFKLTNAVYGYFNNYGILVIHVDGTVSTNSLSYTSTYNTYTCDGLGKGLVLSAGDRSSIFKIYAKF